MKKNSRKRVSPQKAFLVLVSPAVLLVVVLTLGCTDDPEVAIVDFSKTEALERPREAGQGGPYLKVAVAAMVSPKETFYYYRELLNYIGAKLGEEVQLIQRKTYAGIGELLATGEIDLAFICSGPYAADKEKYGLELMATPKVQGSHLYKAYLIVNRNSPFDRLEDLREGVFAFTDPDSNTGRLVPAYWLAEMGERPGEFFENTIYTYSHDNSILAVASALVDGASVDGLIWEYHDHRNSALTSKTRIIRKSDPYGNPPVVASRYLASKEKRRIRDILFSMHLDPEGKKIIEELMIDRFIDPREEWYESIRQMKGKLALLEKAPYASEKP